MLHCACLVAQQEDRLLLVRVRDNQKWYLPGGAIEAGETPEIALARELREELGLSVDPQQLDPLYTVIGPAYGRDGDVALICFAAPHLENARPCAEITELAWLGSEDYPKFAPAVQSLYDQHIRVKNKG